LERLTIQELRNWLVAPRAGEGIRENTFCFTRPAIGGIDVVRVLHAARDIESILDSEES